MIFSPLEQNTGEQIQPMLTSPGDHDIFKPGLQSPGCCSDIPKGLP